VMMLMPNNSFNPTRAHFARAGELRVAARHKEDQGRVTNDRGVAMSLGSHVEKGTVLLNCFASYNSPNMALQPTRAPSARAGDS
jgi:hypothetical protein